MSKAAKTRNRTKRDVEKKRRKAVKKSLYKSYAESGANSRSSRFKRKSKQNKRLATTKHATSACGNYACNKCYLPEAHMKWGNGKLEIT